MTIPTARQLYDAYAQRAKRSLGQHFLLDQRVTEQIAEAAAPTPGQHVLEIGPGPGALTQALARREATIVAVERDAFAAAFLRSQLGERVQLTVVEDDILRYALAPEMADWSAAGNLPYNIATEIFFRFIDLRRHFSRHVFMFQREVAARFVASPNSKQYGVLAVIGEFFYRMRYLMTVPPGAFRPVPKVHSGVVLFEPRETPLPETSGPAFRRVVKAAFGQRRKTLANALTGLDGLDKAGALDLLASAGVDPQRRAEQLEQDAFCRLTEALLARGVRS